MMTSHNARFEFLTAALASEFIAAAPTGVRASLVSEVHVEVLAETDAAFCRAITAAEAIDHGATRP